MKRITRRIVNKARDELRKMNRQIDRQMNRPRFLDIGRPKNLIIVAGMGRSGTTWICEIINHDKSHRLLFEPFFPRKVKESLQFGYLPYIRPDDRDEQLAHQARLILAGKIRNQWVDKESDRFIYKRRILKDIRCNFMLGWLRILAHNPPTILIIRHPLQVASSWLKLGPVMQGVKDKSNFEYLITNQSLLQDYPIIQEVLAQTGPLSALETHIFAWCVWYLVPRYQLKKEDVHILFYENLLCHWDEEITMLFQYLKQPINLEQLQQRRHHPSVTNHLQRDFSRDQAHILNSWKDELSLEQIERGHTIMSAFGLDHLYDSDGYPTGAQYLNSMS